MTSRTGINRRKSAFTLIELILVLVLLAIVVSLAAPSLSRFFRGRTLDSEAKRFLALTHMAQSRAVSEGVPMTLWIDEEQGLYGLEAEASFAQDARKAVEFTADEKIQIQVELPVASGPVTARNMTRTGTAGQPSAKGTTSIRFTPDGFIDEYAPEIVIFHQGDEGEIQIGRSRNRLNYEIQDNQSVSLR